MSISEDLKPMIKRLPWYYRKSKVVNDLYDALTAVLENADAYITSEGDTLFITTTSDFERHEKDVGLKVDASLTDDERRAQVIARLQGYGVLTVQALIDLVTLYEPTGCTVTEDYANYTVYIDMTGHGDNLEAMQAAVEERKPAHIVIYYSYESTDEPTGTVYGGGAHIYDRQLQRLALGDITSTTTPASAVIRAAPVVVRDRQTQVVPAAAVTFTSVTGNAKAAAAVVYDRETIRIIDN